MKNIILSSIILLSIGCFSASKKADKTELANPVIVPQSYISQTIAPKRTVLTNEEKKGVQLNNTKIKISLDELETGVPFDTTILRGSTLTTYSFTPTINIWDKTDTCYSARYFITVDVRQEVTPNAKSVIAKKAIDIDKEIQEQQEKIQRKIKARDAALNTSKN